ncbi:hypothetical protein LBMAG49_11720 [Planctomycetota bacterium]|nr:hypothetical protein LBMAG49_11720 [Planctomycetota bacterium]
MENVEVSAVLVAQPANTNSNAETENDAILICLTSLGNSAPHELCETAAGIDQLAAQT